jgi:cytoskeletal protein CcmA (bactofilin family)
MRRLYLLACLLGFAAVLSLPITTAHAVTSTPAALNIAKEDVVPGNLVKAGNVIMIAGAVNGDVIVAGNTITISGPVAGDVIATGNTIVISGPVGGSVRVVGGNITITGKVERNVWAAGSTIAVGKDATVGWDVIAFSGSTQIDGTVNGNVSAYTGSLIVSGKILKNVEATLGTDGHALVQSTANVGGTFVYRAGADTQLDRHASSTITGAVTYEPLPINERDVRTGLQALFGFVQLVGFFGILVIGLILIGLVPRKLDEMRIVMLARAPQSLGIGALYLIVTPIALIICAVTIIGLPLAAIGSVGFIVSVYLSQILTACTLGWLVLNWIYKERRPKTLATPLILGLLMLVLIRAVPILGMLASAGLCAWALGAWAQVWWQTLKQWR